jgi:hypothetical protein
MTVNISTTANNQWVLAADRRIICKETAAQQANERKIINLSPNSSMMYRGNCQCINKKGKETSIEEIERRLHKSLANASTPKGQAQKLSRFVSHFIDPHQSAELYGERIDPEGNSVISIFGFDGKKPIQKNVLLPTGEIRDPETTYWGTRIQGSAREVFSNLVYIAADSKKKSKLENLILRTIKDDKRKKRLLKTLNSLWIYTSRFKFKSLDSETIRRKLKALTELLVFFDNTGKLVDFSYEENSGIGGPIDTQVISRDSKKSFGPQD